VFHGCYVVENNFVHFLYRYPAFDAFDDFSDFVESITCETSESCQVRGSNPCRGANLCFQVRVKFRVRVVYRSRFNLPVCFVQFPNGLDSRPVRAWNRARFALGRLRETSSWVGWVSVLVAIVVLLVNGRSGKWTILRRGLCTRRRGLWSHWFDFARVDPGWHTSAAARRAQ